MQATAGVGIQRRIFTPLTRSRAGALPNDVTRRKGFSDYSEHGTKSSYRYSEPSFDSPNQSATSILVRILAKEG
jgi:hypothetical protein